MSQSEWWIQGGCSILRKRGCPRQADLGNRCMDVEGLAEEEEEQEVEEEGICEGSQRFWIRSM